MSAPSRGALVATLTVGVIAIGVAGPLFRLAAPTHPLISSATRLELAALLLAPLVFRGLRRGTLSWRAHGVEALIAGLCYAVHFGAWVRSLELTSVAASTTIVCATPLAIAAWGLLTGRDRPTSRQLGAMTVASVGVGLIAWHDSGGAAHALTGDLWAALGALAIAVYLVRVRAIGDALDVFAFSGAACAVGALMLHAAASVQGIPAALPSPQAAGALLLVALIPQLLGHGALTWALRHTSPTTVSLATLGEPPAAIALGWLLLHEAVAPLTALGCALTLGAVAMSLRE